MRFPLSSSCAAFLLLIVYVLLPAKVSAQPTAILDALSTRPRYAIIAKGFRSIELKALQTIRKRSNAIEDKGGSQVPKGIIIAIVIAIVAALVTAIVGITVASLKVVAWIVIVTVVVGISVAAALLSRRNSAHE